VCQTPRNLKVLPTKEITYNKEDGTFSLMCDNPDCRGEKMVAKEGDALGVASIKERLRIDEKLIQQAFSLYGIPKILLRNSVPIDKVQEYVDDYEITPGYSYEWDEKTKKVNVIEKPWEIPDDEGVPSNSLLPPPVVVSLIKQMVEALAL